MCASRVCPPRFIERVEHWPRPSVANSLVFSARKRYRSRQKTVTPELRSRKALYRQVSTTGTMPIRPISVEPCPVKPRCIRVYRLPSLYQAVYRFLSFALSTITQRT